MHNISDEQVEFILHDIEKKGIKTEDVRYNLLDHICCIIEHEMPDGGNFNKFYEDTLKRFFTRDLSEIEEETQNLLKFKDYYAMKTTLKISGLTSAVLMLAGATFKSMHWPGAGVMIVLGCAAFALLFLPLMIVLKFKDEETTTDKVVLSFGFLTGIVAALGSLFKVMHWPFANIMMTSSTIAFIFIFVPLYFFTRFRRPENQFNTIVNSVLMMACGGMIFALINLGFSTNIKGSVNASYTFMNNNTARLMKANKLLLNGKQNEFHNYSEQLYNQIKDAKINLISNVDGIDPEYAADIDILSMKDPNDNIKTRHSFVNGKGKLGMNGILESITKYNELIQSKFPNNPEMLISIDELQLDRTIASVVLQELSQIQLQIVMNENSYLQSVQ